MKTRDQFTMLKLDKSMGELQEVPYFPWRIKLHFNSGGVIIVVTITMTMIAENTASSRILSPLTARVSPMPAKINPTSPGESCQCRSKSGSDFCPERPTRMPASRR